MKTDLELIQDVKSGMKKSFEELVRRHERFLIKVVVRMTRDLNAAEDVVQDSFIKAYKRLHLFEGRASFRSWLYQIALNTTRNRFRKTSRETIGTEHMDIVVEGEVDQHMSALDVRGLLQKEIDRLPDRQRTALSLRVFEDLSFKEIAEIMQCPYDTAKANYRHALLKLKARLEGNVALKTWSEQPRFSLLELGVNQMEVDG
ncbi:MAG: sigma-70 family RNA polymerase sigma factor [Bdellovibrionales bacterium]|nr:sigma-70 family RNA polymerase sigma factor [Bdellovibrionales bacterium]